MSITVGSYNILNPIYAVTHKQHEGLNSNGLSNWNTRKNEILKNISSSKLDVICLQELSFSCFKDLKNDLEKLGYDTKHQSHVGNQDGVAIIYKKNKFKLNATQIENGSSKGYKRAHFYVELEDTKTHMVTRIATCHIRDGGDVNAPQQINDVRDMIEKNSQNVDVCVVAGDFNSTITDKKINQLVSAKFSTDGSTEISENPNKNYPTGRRIDFIFLKSFGTSAATIKPLVLNKQNQASDHLLVASTIEYKINNNGKTPKKPESSSVKSKQPAKQSQSFFGRIRNWFQNIFKAIASWFKS